MAGGPVTADLYEAIRPRLFALSYRMLGSVSEAEDIVQEALLRAHDARDSIEVPEAWLVSVTTRLALDTLRSARVRRETYVGPWLPEPLVAAAGEAPDPAERGGAGGAGWAAAGEAPDRAEREAAAESVSLALLVVLESLSATERVAFVLHDVFGYEFE